jgi:hypothetical protein
MSESLVKQGVKDKDKEIASLRKQLELEKIRLRSSPQAVENSTRAHKKKAKGKPQRLHLSSKTTHRIIAALDEATADGKLSSASKSNADIRVVFEAIGQEIIEDHEVADFVALTGNDREQAKALLWKKAEKVKRIHSMMKNLAASGTQHKKWGYAPEHIKNAALTAANPKNMANLKMANQARKRKQQARRIQQQQSNPFLDVDEEEDRGTSLEAAEELLAADMLLSMAQRSPRSGGSSQVSATPKGRVPAQQRDEFAFGSSDSESGDSEYESVPKAKKSRHSVTDNVRASDKSLSSTPAKCVRPLQKSNRDVPGTSSGRVTSLYSEN